MMRDLFHDKYRYAAVFSDSAVWFEPAGQKDIKKLAAMYESVRITRNNYKSRFDPYSEQSFGNIGGIFNALDEEDIERILNDNNSSILTAKLGGNIAALLWVSRNDPSFVGYKPADLEVESAANSGKLIYFRDIIAAGTGVSKKIPLLLLYTAVQLAKQMKYTHSVAEIYKVMAYHDGNRREVEILNSRSLNVALSSGGRLAGELPLKTVSADGILIDVIPSVVSFEYAAVLNTLEEKITALNIKIRRGA